MPTIELKFKGNKIKDHSIAIGQGYNIGRKKANDIVIDNLAVSGFHAQIDSVSTTFVLRDLDSTNGTFVNNKKITMHNLKHGDSILIGKHELIFDCSDIVSMRAAKPDALEEKTRFLDTNDFRKLTGQKAAAPSGSNTLDANPTEPYTEKPVSFFAKILQKIFGR